MYKLLMWKVKECDYFGHGKLGKVRKCFRSILQTPWTVQNLVLITFLPFNSEEISCHQYVTAYKLSIVLFFFVSYQRDKGSQRSNAGVQAPYLHVLGIYMDSEKSGFSSSSIPISTEEEELFRRLASSPNVYDRIAKSIAPSIFGFEDIKKAIACLLFGGKP